MCTYHDCPEPDAMYTNRAAWLDHEAQSHRKVWRCFEHTDLFRTKEELQHHLNVAHPVLGSVQAQALADLGSATTHDERRACPFCFITGPSQKDLANHMASHMEALASFSILRSAGANEGESSANGSSRHAKGDRSTNSLNSVALSFTEQNSDGTGADHDTDVTILQHDDEVNEVAFSPDGRLLASGEDKGVKIWDLSTHQCVKSLKETKMCVSVSLSSDGSKVASAFHNRSSIYIWDLTTFECTIINPESMVSRLAFSPVHNLLAASGDGETIEVWDVTTVTRSQTLRGHESSVFGVAFSPDGLQLASASGDRLVKLWDSATGECTQTLHGHEDRVVEVVFLPDGRLLASASGDKTIKIWDVHTTEYIRTLQGHIDSVWSVAASPNGSYLASGSGDATVRVWDVETGECILELEGHGKSVSSVAFSPDGGRLASGSYDGTVRIWPIRRMLRQKGWS